MNTCLLVLLIIWFWVLDENCMYLPFLGSTLFLGSNEIGLSSVETSWCSYPRGLLFWVVTAVLTLMHTGFIWLLSEWLLSACYAKHAGKDLDYFALFSVASYTSSHRVVCIMLRNEGFYPKFHLNVVIWRVFKKKKNHFSCFVAHELHDGIHESH